MSDLRHTTGVGPHPYRPLKWWDTLFREGRCWHCYLPRRSHPIHCYVPARPIGDMEKAEECFRNCHFADRP